MTLILVVLAVMLASVLLGSRLLLLLALVTGAAAVYLIGKLVQMHRAMNRHDPDDAGER